MNANKINYLILPLLISILLTAGANLKIGRFFNSLAYAVTSPVVLPLGHLRTLTNSQISLIKKIPSYQKENLELKLTNSYLMTENQNLKNAIKDQNTIDRLAKSKSTLIPVRLVNFGNIITVTTTQSFDQIASGQPVVIGSILVGFVSSVAKPVISVTPLSDEKTETFRIVLGSGQTGTYQFLNRLAQVSNIPSQNPLALGDTVFTQPTETTPGNLIIGKITKILSSAQEPLQKAEVKLEMSLDENSENLSIIIKP